MRSVLIVKFLVIVIQSSIRVAISAMVDLHKLAQAMCSIDLPESNWTQVS